MKYDPTVIIDSHTVVAYAGNGPIPIVVGGDVGPAGPAGPAGPTGAAGNTILNGNGAPSAGTGANGDYYIDNTADSIYGPKTSGAWGAPTSLVGPQGVAGPRGYSVLSGTGNPTGAIGVDGDFYINTTTTTIFGPKAAGAWPTGVSMIGPQGVQGVPGKSVLNGTAAPSAGTGVDGDFYIRTTTNEIYGPKVGTAWGSPTSLVGPQGVQGPRGFSVLNGTAAPTGGVGVDGDFYIRTSDNTIYGPKTAGAWGSPTSLVGPQGPQGIQGPPGGVSGSQTLLYSATASVGTPANTNETDLHSYTMPANTLNADGLGLRISSFGDMAAVTRSRAARVYFGGVNIATIGPSSSATLTRWGIVVTIVRRGSAVEISYAETPVNSTTTNVVKTLLAVDTTAPIVIKVTGQSGGSAVANDITSELFSVEFLSASLGGGSVNDAAFGAGWNGVTNVSPSQNAIYDEFVKRPVLTGGNSFVGNQSIGGDPGIGNATLSVTPYGSYLYSSLQLKGTGGAIAQGLNILAGGAVAYLDADAFTFRNATSREAFKLALGGDIYATLGVDPLSASIPATLTIRGQNPAIRLDGDANSFYPSIYWKGAVTADSSIQGYNGLYFTTDGEYNFKTDTVIRLRITDLSTIVSNNFFAQSGQVSFGVNSGVATDNAIYFDTTNYYHFHIWRQWRTTPGTPVKQAEMTAADGGFYWGAPAHVFRSLDAATTFGTINSTGAVLNGLAHSFGTTVAGAGGLQVSWNTPGTQTDFFFNSHNPSGTQDASLHAVKGVGLYLNGNPSLKLRAAGVDIGQVNSGGIDLAAGKAFSVNGVPIGGGGGLTDGDKGDVVVGGGGTTLTVESATPASGTFAVTISGTNRFTVDAGGPSVPAGDLKLSAGSDLFVGRVLYWGATGTLGRVIPSATEVEYRGVSHRWTDLTGNIWASINSAGKLTTLASAAGGAGFNLPHGAAPSAPVNGDMWTTTAGVFHRSNGATIQLTPQGLATASGLTLAATARLLGRNTAGAGAVEEVTGAQALAMIGAAPARPAAGTQSTNKTAADADNNSHIVFSGASRTLTLGSLTAGTAFTGRFTTAWSISCAGGLSKNGAAPGGVTTGTIAANSLITFYHEGSGVWVASGTGLT